jgi:TetR/AcrR family transcriptional regulator, mexJK operon transcriptional repressor
MSRGTSTAKHKAIVDAALSVFLEKGYLGTSMDGVAAAAGVSKQTVYKHFIGKERLFADIVLSTVDDVERLVRWTLAEFRDTANVAQTFDRLAHRFLRALMEPRLLRLRRLVLSNADRFPQLGRTWYESGFERVLATLADCLRQLTDAGVLRTKDPLIAANHFVGMLLWIPINNAMFTGNEKPFTDRELRRLAKQSADAFLRAYGTVTGERRPSVGKGTSSRSPRNKRSQRG